MVTTKTVIPVHLTTNTTTSSNHNINNATTGATIMMLSGHNNEFNDNKSVLIMNATATPAVTKKSMKMKKSANSINNLSNMLSGSGVSGSVTVTSKNGGKYQPPSPPSSSDTESDHSSSAASTASSSSSTTTTTVTVNSNGSTSMPSVTKNKSSNKLNAGIKLNKLLKNGGGTIVKQLRHQPYSVKSPSKHGLKNKSSHNNSNNNTNNNNNNSNNDTYVSIKYEDSDSINLNNLNCSMNSDDDCWPFFCSLNVNFNYFIVYSLNLMIIKLFLLCVLEIANIGPAFVDRGGEAHSHSRGPSDTIAVAAEQERGEDSQEDQT